MKAEDEAVARSFSGSKAKQSKEKSADGMEIYSGGDVTMHYHGSPSGSQPAPAAPEKKAGAGWLPRLLLVASMLGGGAGVGYIVNDLMKPPGEFTDTDTDTDTVTEMYFP